LPEPTYVVEAPHFDCATNDPEECTIYTAWIANTLSDARRDTQAAAQDIQVRLDRAICAQHNLNDQLSFMRSQIVGASEGQ
jgi:hypothetical protein